MPSTTLARPVAHHPTFFRQVGNPGPITTLEQARPLFRGVKRWESTEGFYELRAVRIPLALSSTLHPGVKGYTRIANTPTGAIIDRIVLARGQPARFMSGIMAHEFMEAWLAIIGMSIGQVDWQHEGLCELVRYEFLRAVNTRYTREYMRRVSTNLSRAYSDGFRRQQERFAGMTLAQIAEYIRTTRRLR